MAYYREICSNVSLTRKCHNWSILLKGNNNKKHTSHKFLENKNKNKNHTSHTFHNIHMRINFNLIWPLDTNWSSMKYSMERSQSRKQAKISLYNHDYIHQKENMLANATLRPECKHFQSHRSPKEPLSYKFTTLHACNVQVVCFFFVFLFFFTHKRIHSILL